MLGTVIVVVVGIFATVICMVLLIAFWVLVSGVVMVMLWFPGLRSVGIVAIPLLFVVVFTIVFPVVSLITTGSPGIGVPVSSVAFIVAVPFGSTVTLTLDVCLSVVTDMVLFTGLLFLSPG